MSLRGDRKEMIEGSGGLLLNLYSMEVSSHTGTLGNPWVSLFRIELRDTSLAQSQNKRLFNRRLDMLRCYRLLFLCVLALRTVGPTVGQSIDGG